MASGRGVGKLGESQPRIREVLKRYPKLRGYRFTEVEVDFVIVNLQRLEKAFAAGETVNPTRLLEKRVIRTIRGRVPKVKILGTGELTKALNVEGCMVSESVKAKIVKAGGKVS